VQVTQVTLNSLTFAFPSLLTFAQQWLDSRELPLSNTAIAILVSLNSGFVKATAAGSAGYTSRSTCSAILTVPFFPSLSHSTLRFCFITANLLGEI
jgi:hypothetical protein